MKEVLKRLADLRTLSGNAQISYLRSVASPLLREVLEYTLDTHKTYKITEKKYNKAMLPLFNTSLMNLDRNQPLTVELWNKFKDMLDYLASVKAATDEDVQRVKNLIETCSERDFLKMVLYKDLRLGLDRKTCQKVWEDFCVTFPYMGCKPFSKKDLAKIPYPAFAQTKMDGTFCNVIIDLVNKKTEYVSRQSKPQNVRGCFLDNCFYDGRWLGDAHFTNKFVLTGELLVWDNETNRPLPRKIGNGIIKRDNKTQDELDRIHLTVWDFIPYENFLQKKWNVPYSDRWSWLQTRLNGFHEKLHLVNTWTVNSLEEAMARFEEEYEKGEEGVVIKAFSQIWQDGKPAGQVKIKAEKDCELRMIGFEEGKGAYAGMCGNILCTSEDGLLEVRVKPRTPEESQIIWDHQDSFYKKILTVKFNEVIHSETKEKASLYLPVFVEVRNDKAVADTYEYINAL